MPVERCAELRHIAHSAHAAEAAACLQQRGADPAKHHLAIAPALHVARVVSDRAVQVLNRVGAEKRQVERAAGRTLRSEAARRCGKAHPTMAGAPKDFGRSSRGSVSTYCRCGTAYSTQDGKILWEYDTVQEFTTVNAVKARGGSINNGGSAIAGGMVFTNAGYSHHSGIIPGNVLLAFSAQ